jgi:hypothetical protein
MGQPNNNGGAPVDRNTTFVYQTIVAPVRGFLSNTRNGASAASANIELRVSYLFGACEKSFEI